MIVTDAYALTDKLAKTDSSQFSTAEKLVYFNIAKNLLFMLIAIDQEDRNEEEQLVTTVAGQRQYAEKARIHHVNWVKINYGDGFIPARHLSEADQIALYGTDLETALSQWDKSDPIYWVKGSNLNIAPTASAAQAGADRLKYSLECYPPDMTTGSDVIPLPIALEHIPSVYAAFRYHDTNGEDGQAAKRAAELPDGMLKIDVSDITPRARQAEIVGGVPDDDGSGY